MRHHMHERCDSGHTGHRRGRGPSSFWMHDPEEVFRHLGLRPGERFLDLGSGPGDYSIKAAELMGPRGVVVAVDRSENAWENLTHKAADLGYEHIKPMISDITGALPFVDDFFDMCFISTVLHIFPWPKFHLDMFAEIRRVLRPDGRLAIIECQKEEQQWGPPMHMRISPQEMEEGLGAHGFKRISYCDLGKTYLIQFGLS